MFVSGLDEMALPSEIGLYFDFNVTADGIPYGCPGFETFTSVGFNQSKTNGLTYVVTQCTDDKFHDFKIQATQILGQMCLKALAISLGKE